MGSMQAGQKTVLGVDVGGTKILIGLVTSEGSILHSKRYEMDRSTQDTTLASIWNAVDDYRKETAHFPDPVAAGLGVVGVVDAKNGIWVRAVNVPIRHSVDMSQAFEARYGIPAAIDNDVHAATLAELTMGAGADFNDFVYLNVGTGIAAGIVSNRNLIRGVNNAAGEIGHMIIRSHGDKCKCGQRGCLEPLASGGDIIAYAKATLPEYPSSVLHELDRNGELTALTIFAAADQKDPLASDIADRAVTSLGQAVLNLMTLLDTEAIILGGGLFNGTWLFDHLCEYVQENYGVFAKPAYGTLRLSELDTGLVGLLGAASIAWDKHRMIENDRLNIR